MGVAHWYETKNRWYDSIERSCGNGALVEASGQRTLLYLWHTVEAGNQLAMGVAHWWKLISDNYGSGTLVKAGTTWLWEWRTGRSWYYLAMGGHW